MDYVINESHLFKITISAHVVPKTLVVGVNEIKMGGFSHNDAFQPRSVPIALHNPLTSPVTYHWNIPADSSFEIEPVTGKK